MVKFKNLIAGVLAIALCVSCTGCTVEDSSDGGKKNEIVSVDDGTDNADKGAALPTISEQVLWEVDGLKVTATGIEDDDFWGTQIKLLVENNGDKDVSLSTDAVIINDYMFNDLTSIDVTAGNKANENITLFSSELEKYGIENIGKIELYLHTFDPETYETLKSSECITIKTSNFDNMDTSSSVSDGTVLYEEAGVKVVGKYVDEDDFWGQAVLLYIENNSDKNVTVQAEDTSIDGVMVDAIMSADVYAGKKAFDTMTFLESELEENGITEINTIETSFQIIDEDFNTIADSGKITFSTK